MLQSPNRPTLRETLQAHIDDPMWAYHAEVNKALLMRVVNELDLLEAKLTRAETAGRGLAEQLAARDSRIRQLEAFRDEVKRVHAYRQWSMKMQDYRYATDPEGLPFSPDYKPEAMTVIPKEIP